eukprot:9789802-Alexandrium_andersonii.AAC.1
MEALQRLPRRNQKEPSRSFRTRRKTPRRPRSGARSWRLAHRGPAAQPALPPERGSALTLK